MKHGLWLQNGPTLDVHETVEWAVAAEEGGWDGVCVSDAIEDGYSDPLTVLAAIAARTERIALFTWVVPVPAYLPWRLAHILATLDRLSEGRLMVGCGLGTRMEHEAFGGSYDGPALGRRYDESLEIMTALWRGDTVDHEGEFFTLREATLPFLPVQQPRIPILAAAWWPAKAPVRRGARWDGIMPYWPALLGDEEGPEGQQPTGADPAAEFRELMAYYHEHTDEVGEVVVPNVRVPGIRDVYEELGATWLLSGAGSRTKDEVLAGPPAPA